MEVASGRGVASHHDLANLHLTMNFIAIYNMCMNVPGTLIMQYVVVESSMLSGVGVGGGVGWGVGGDETPRAARSTVCHVITTCLPPRTRPTRAYLSPRLRRMSPHRRLTAPSSSSVNRIMWWSSWLFHVLLPAMDGLAGSDMGLDGASGSPKSTCRVADWRARCAVSDRNVCREW